MGCNRLIAQYFCFYLLVASEKPVFLNVHGARESIPRNEFRQPM